jgi:hypothetical protein
MKKSVLVSTALLIMLSISSQGTKNLAEMLGYPKDSKLLVIHADDMGLNQMIVHPAIDNEEMQAISKWHNDYGSTWRQNDLDLVSSKEFRDLLTSNHIILIGWKQISDLINK